MHFVHGLALWLYDGVGGDTCLHFMGPMGEKFSLFPRIQKKKCLDESIIDDTTMDGCFCKETSPIKTRIDFIQSG